MKTFVRVLGIILSIILISSSTVGCGKESLTNYNTENYSAEQIIKRTSFRKNSAVGIETTGLNFSYMSADDIEQVEESQSITLSSTQRNSINMLNYLTVLAQEINNSKGNQLFLESAYSSLINDMHPNAVDIRTEAQIDRLMDTIDNYRMIAVKRDRLEYIYEQNRAQALRQAIPNPIGLLSAVRSGNVLEKAVSVLYMAADSVSSYNSAASQADLEFIKEGWELDDAESKELHNNTKDVLSYMLDMVRDYDLPGDYALSPESVQDFVKWSCKPDSQLAGKIAWLESHKSTYQEFGSYWLEMVKDYYNCDEYDKCLEAIKQYEKVSARIFRKDIDYATSLPMAIVASKKTMDQNNYIKTAEEYCKAILSNIKDSDWSFRYFVAQTYLDLYSLSKRNIYLDEAYKAAFDNVVVLVDNQRKLNNVYLAPVKEVEVNKDANKRVKKETNNYNKFLKEERKTALPPVDEALYLNCDLLFALADEMNISTSKKNQIDSILHGSGENIFLTQTLDNRFWIEKDVTELKADEIDISFDGEKLTLPATCVSDRSTISVTVNGDTKIDDWTVTNVKRPKGSSCSEFIVYYESETGKDYEYQAGDKVTINVTPVVESPDKSLEFAYNAVEAKVAFAFKGVKFERIMK